MITVFAQYYVPKSTLRRKEIDACFKKNLENSLISKFIIYFENDKIQCLENCHRDHLELDIHHFYKNYDETIAYIERLEGPVTMKLNVFRPKVVSNLA
jgi:hypothetical protein